MISDADLLALCAFKEANLEPDDGLAAVIRVIKNRMAVHYQSDGTVAGTVLHGNGAAFSWVGFDMVNGHYQRVANGPDEIAERVATLLTKAELYQYSWTRALRISQAVMDGTYSGPEYANLTDDAVMYANLDISAPAWASDDKLITKIGHHSFFTA